MSFPTLYASKLAIFPAAADATPPVFAHADLRITAEGRSASHRVESSS
jgi:hypothetical protein